ncbi:MAG: NAD-dependent epimerase/dehydratase family protein [Bacteroidales bacterium]|nr:NAD-dependent epimerase/dehydratase family protein [Bacteroidales bacterium]
MNILITGINGFVGSNFTEKWKEHHILYGLDITQNPKDGMIAIYNWEQLTEIPETDAIVHLAGKAQDTKNESEAAEYFAVNTGLTQKIFDYFLESSTQKFIFFSSVKAAAESVHGEYLIEDAAPAPKGPYGESKIKAEEYLLSKLSQAEKLQKKVYIVRPCMIHGPGNKGNLNLLYQVVSKGIPWPLGAFDNRRSFCSIDNIAFAVEQLIVRDDIPSGIYQVCDDEALSTNELIGLINESLGKKTLIWKLPKAFMTAAAGVCGALHLPLDKERLRKLTENYVVSNRKIKSALGIEKMPISAREGIRKTLESFKKVES